MRIWAMVALYGLGCVSLGAWLVRRWSNGVQRDGFWGLSFAAGLAAFTILISTLGWAQLLMTETFFLLPLLMILTGARTLVEEWIERRRLGRVPFTALELVVGAFGVACIFLLCLQVLDPNNINFDARWYHLRVAERYALAEGMMRSTEGDQLLTLPQGASLIYTWAFMAPLTIFEDKLILAMHMELTAVLGTLALIPAMVRVLMPTLDPRTARFAWVVFFFFPSVFIYDTGLMGGADHIVAVWGLAVPLALWQARDRKSYESWALVGLLGVGLLSKYTAVYLLVPMVPLLLIDWAWRWRKAGKAFTQREKLGPVLAMGMVLVFTAPYWLRNWIWYGNPVYPAGSSIFPNRPWAQDAAAWNFYYKVANTWTTTGTLSYRAKETVQSLVNYPLQPYTWGDMVENQSVFGFSFLVSLLAIPFIKPKWRVAIVALMLNGSIAVWFNTHQHHMRYLTVAMPLMGCVAAAVALHLWSLRTYVGRVAVLVVVGAHLAAFGDVPFRRTHGMNGRRSPIESSLEYIALKGHRGWSVGDWLDMAKSLPPRAMPVVHGVRAPLGMGRQSIADFVTLQFGLDYGRQGSASGAWEKLRQLGGTHLVWGSASTQFESVAGEAFFYGIASRTTERRNYGTYYVGELPMQPPDELGEGILYLGCALYEPGLYKAAALAEPLAPFDYPYPTAVPTQRVTTADWQAQLPRATYVVMENACGFDQPMPPEFERQGDQLELPKKTLTYFVRRSGSAQGWN